MALTERLIAKSLICSAYHDGPPSRSEEPSERDVRLSVLK